MSYETPRRTQTMRMPDELQLPAPQQIPGQATPGITLQQATPQSTMYAGTNSATTATSTTNNNSGVPGSLQPGGSGRPQQPQSAYTATTTVPTLPHINTNA